MKKSLKKYIKWILAAIVLLMVYLLYPIREPDYSYSTVVNDRKGNLLSASIAADGQWRFPEPDSIPDKIAKCVQYFEDRHFYRHLGINPLAIARATRQNLSEGRVVSGASTLTMQIARMMRNRNRTLWQKLVEIGIAIKLELRYSKKELMKKYLAMAPFGGNVVGVEAASWRYFNRPPHLLSWGESATLAVLPNNPGTIYPGRSTASFKAKRDRLLTTLFTYGIIDSLTYEVSLLEALPEKPFPLPRKARHLLNTIKKEAPGTITGSTLDPFWQEQTSRIVARHHQRLSGNGVENICAMVVDLETAEVLAYVGNTNDPNAEGNNVDIIRRPRSPGSSLKPILFAHALERGAILPQTLLPDIPSFFGGFTPKNFSGGFMGAVPADESLVRSLNVPFAYLLRTHTYEQFHADLKRDGITTLNHPPGHYGLTLILGGAEVTLWDLSTVYVKMYRELAGKKPHQISFTSHHQETERLNLGSPSIWHTFNAITQLSRPVGEQEWESFSSSQLIAWKTGTSFGFRDAWAIGLNGNVCVAVWTGNADGEGRAGLTGINSSAPVLHELMRLSDHDPKWLEKLKPVMRRFDVCLQSGKLAGKNCPAEKRELPDAAENSGVCLYHKEFLMDETMSFRVNSSCYSLISAVRKTHFILPASLGYYYGKTHPNYKGLPPLHPDCRSGQTNPIQIIYPNVNSNVFIPKNLDGEVGKVILEASHQDNHATLYWHIDDQFIKETKGDHQVEVWLEKGTHLLMLVDNEGNEVRRSFRVVNDR